MLRRRPQTAAGGPARRVRKEADGTLVDTVSGEPVTIEQLRSDLLAGRFFRARRADSLEDCTNELLAEVIMAAVPEDDLSSTTLSTFAPLLQALGRLDSTGGTDDRG